MKTERPKWNDEMTKELAEIVGKIVFDWCGQDTPFEQCVADSEKILKHHSDEDGYKLAKEFEDEGYSADTMLVEELDCVNNLASVVLMKNIERWVKDNDIKLLFSIGDALTYDYWRGKTKSGLVVKLYPESNRYGIRDESQSESCHSIVEAEKIVTLDYKRLPGMTKLYLLIDRLKAAAEIKHPSRKWTDEFYYDCAFAWLSKEDQLYEKVLSLENELKLTAPAHQRDSTV